MDYRDERDALRGRVENLEQELNEAKGASSIAQLEAGIAEAETLTDALRRALAAIKDAQATPPGGSTVPQLEAEIERAEGLIQRFRHELSALKDGQRAPVAAEALVRRLRDDLSGLEAARREPGFDAPQPEPAPKPPSAGRSAKIGIGIGIGLAGAAIAILGVADVVRLEKGRRAHRDACQEAAACCQSYHVDAGRCATEIGNDCTWYIVHYACNDRLATSVEASVQPVEPVQTVEPALTLEPVLIGDPPIPCRVTLDLSKTGSGPGAFDEAWHIAIDPEGSAYVADKTGRIQRFDHEGNLVSTIHAETTNKPHGPLSTDIGYVLGLAVDSKHVFASIGYDVVSYDAVKGNVVTKVPHAFPSTCFWEIVIDQTGALLVLSACTDSDRYQMVRMNVHGRVLATFPEGRAWQLDTSNKMGVDRAGNIYAPHRYEDQIYVLDPRGKETRRIGNVDKPGPVVIDARSRLFVRSRGDDIIMFETGGRLLGPLKKCWQSGSLNDLAIGPDGQLWVATDGGVTRLEVGKR